MIFFEIFIFEILVSKQIGRIFAEILSGAEVRKFCRSHQEFSNECSAICSQKSASIDPKTILSKFGRDSIHISIHFLVASPRWVGGWGSKCM